MRLIDADMLSPDRDYYDNSICSGYNAVSCQQIDSATTVKAIPLDKIKQAREDINSKYDSTVPTFDDYGGGRNDMVCIVLEILDTLIAESED